MSDLARHFAYPEIARQHGWQGKVLLGFEVLADGRLDRIHVARSSGYYVLDQSAVNSIAQIERVFGANRWLHGYPVDMQIPVIYRLMEP
jgi:protein TonB